MMRTSTLSGRRAPTGSTSPSCRARSSLTCAAERQFADFVEEQRAAVGLDWNLPTCLSVAPVKAPFSWPNRIDSTRFSGNGAAVDRDEGLGPARRTSRGWRGRSVPCRRRIRLRSAPGWWTARRPLRQRAAPCAWPASGRRVVEGQRAVAAALEPVHFAGQRAERERVAQMETCSRSGLAGLTTKSVGAGAHRRHRVVDAAMRGLHDDRDVEAGLAHARQARRARRDRASPGRAPGSRSRRLAPRSAGRARHRRLPPPRLVAETADHGFDQPALHRIVVDDKHTSDINDWRPPANLWPNLGNVAGRRCNGVLNAPASVTGDVL